MKLFPKEHKRTKTSVPFAVSDGDDGVLIERHSVIGVERLPLIVHRKVRLTGEHAKGDFTVHRNLWTMTHVFTGLNIGVHGSYEFVSTIANRLLEEPILYLPTHKMMTEHPDWRRVFELVSDLKQAHWDLGGKKS